MVALKVEVYVYLGLYSFLCGGIIRDIIREHHHFFNSDFQSTSPDLGGPQRNYTVI